MENRIKQRVLKEAKYILKSSNTIRQASKYFGVSKSTIHKDLKDRLKMIDLDLYNSVQNLMKIHIETRHIKGGASTKKKYEKIHNFI